LPLKICWIEIRFHAHFQNIRRCEKHKKSSVHAVYAVFMWSLSLSEIIAINSLLVGLPRVL
jgi:hypothetical protein